MWFSLKKVPTIKKTGAADYYYHLSLHCGENEPFAQSKII
jgi:hypothetical protein